nr:PREDICTED: uncharacterized protein LOC109035048 [Bemisia tabaci]
MADYAELNVLPPGWDSKYDPKTGRRYYVNYITRNASLEDPRLRRGPLSLSGQTFESIPIQHGSPQLSDARSSYNQPPFYHFHQDHLSYGKCSPLPSRTYSPLMGSSAADYHAYKMNESPYGSSNTIEQSVAKISALFPTVGETHIKTLLLKYHNREAVVVSALQVEKHPLATPGPYTSSLSGRQYSLQMTPPPGGKDSPRSGVGIITSPFRNTSPRPHSSPKMKLRYLKSVFPVVEETVLLDTLCGADNNVHLATEQLLTMGFNKRDTPTPRVVLKKRDEAEEEEEKLRQLLQSQRRSVSSTLPPRMRSLEEKQDMKVKLKEQFKTIPERVIALALDSTNYDEERAAIILKTTVDQGEQEDQTDDCCKEKILTENDNCTESTSVYASPLIVGSSSDQNVDSSALNKENMSKHSKTRKEVLRRVSKGTSVAEDKTFKSPLRLKTAGANSSLVKGPNESLLIRDYVPWNGPDQRLISPNSSQIVPKGPNKSLLGQLLTAVGVNKELRKGPGKNLAKGSIYSPLASKNDDSQSISISSLKINS